MVGSSQLNGNFALRVLSVFWGLMKRFHIETCFSPLVHLQPAFPQVQAIEATLPRSDGLSCNVFASRERPSL